MSTAKTELLKDLWNDSRLQSLPKSARPPALSLQSPRRRPSHHQLRRRQHQLQVRHDRPLHRQAAASSPSRLRRRHRLNQRNRLRDPLYGPPHPASKASTAGEAFEDEMVSFYPSPPSVTISRRLHRHRLYGFLPWDHVDTAPRLGHRQGRQRQRRAQDAGIQQGVRPQHRLDPLAAPRPSNSPSCWKTP